MRKGDCLIGRLDESNGHTTVLAGEARARPPAKSSASDGRPAEEDDDAA